MAKLRHTTRSSVTIRLSQLAPGVRLTLDVEESRRKRDRKKRPGRHMVVIEMSEGALLEIIDEKEVSSSNVT